MQGGDIGYIRVVQFNENTGDELKKAIDSIAAEVPADKLKGYVVDLRNNPGGVLDGAIAASDAFLDGGDIVAIGGRSASDAKHIRVKASNLSNGKRVVVLDQCRLGVDRRSRRRRTAGQSSRHVDRHAHLWRRFGVDRNCRSAAARACSVSLPSSISRPRAMPIEAKGISPDIEVPQDLPDNLKSRAKIVPGKKPVLQSYIPTDPNADKALNRAYAELRGTHAN